MYVLHPSYAPDATHYLRAFSLLQGDLLRLFEYVEPADANESTYSYRCLELLIRACGEVEANCRAILDANGFVASARPTMEHYRRLDRTHHLSSYQVRLPVWAGTNAIRRPFAAWAEGKTLAWFKAHHGGKHNRQSEFPSANFGHVVDAVAGVVVLLSAQFITHEFTPILLAIISADEPKSGFVQGIGGYFAIKFPEDWDPEDRYDFDWQALRNVPSPFQQLTF